VHKTKGNFNSLAVRATSTRRDHLRGVEIRPSFLHGCEWQPALERSTIPRGICVSSAAIAGTISKVVRDPSLPSNVPKMLGQMDRTNLVSGGERTGSHSPLPSPIVLCPSGNKMSGGVAPEGLHIHTAAPGAARGDFYIWSVVSSLARTEDSVRSTELR
jgi:hypothetical protein